MYDPFRAREDAWRPMEVMPVSPGSWISLLPITVLLASVIATKRSLESMVAAIAVGFMLTDGLAFTFNQVNSELGLIPFIIGKATPLLSPALFPLVIFVILGFVAFLVGISWSLYLIAFPLVIPLAQALGADLVLAVAATVAAGTMGQPCCFYSDGTILVSASTGCDNIRHALSQFPYAMMAAGLAGIAFLIAGVLSA